MVYKSKEITITLEIVGADGKKLKEPIVISGLHYGDPYDVELPNIPGYTRKEKHVSGTCGVDDRAIRILYLKLEDGFTMIDDYNTPLFFGISSVNVGECWE